MAVVSKHNTMPLTETSYFIRFKDGVTLPAVLEKGAKQPTLTLSIDGEKKVLSPWEGEIIYDRNSGVISGNENEVTLTYVEDMSWGRDLSTRYSFKWLDYSITLDVDHLHYYKDPDGGYLPENCVRYFRVSADISKDHLITLSEKHKAELAQIITSCVCAINLSTGYKYRFENPNTEIILLSSLPDTELSFKAR